MPAMPPTARPASRPSPPMPSKSKSRNPAPEPHKVVRPRFTNRTTSRMRGPCTASTRSSSMSLVAGGPEIQASGRCGSSRGRACGSEATVSSGARTMQMWWSGTRVRARRLREPRSPSAPTESAPNPRRPPQPPAPTPRCPPLTSARSSPATWALLSAAPAAPATARQRMACVPSAAPEPCTTARGAAGPASR